MKFSLFYEMQIASPTRETEAQMFRDAVEQVVLADQLGYHCVWEVEHHGLLEYSHSSAPEIFLAYVAARTQRIRLGHGVTLTPYRYNHPIRIAERIATLDILSGGRVSWGSGKSASKVEQLAFENDVGELHAQWLEALDMIPRMWQSDVFEYEGKFHRVPPTQIVPKPVQAPHPPIFAACSRPDSAEAVGALGIGALNFAIGTDEYLTKKVAGYHAAFDAGPATPYAKNRHFACTPVALCLPDDREACRHGFRGARFFAEALGFYYFSNARPLGPVKVSRDFLPDDALETLRAQRLAPGSFFLNVIGDPASCREMVSRFQKAGVDELILGMQVGTVPHELVMQSIRTFGEQVMPHVA
jgi:alkanesulfonate monooxygenase SsuD/methylene tetrahydromethanopterin reductase-like flavin-dependent oxidoreductase (luciferase family)